MTKGQNLGRALVRKSKTKSNFCSDRHTSISSKDWSRLPVRSVTEENTFDEFFNIAELANTEFKAERRKLRIVSAAELSGLPTVSRDVTSSLHQTYQHQLVLPRRPAWTYDMTADELNLREKDAFLTWRRSLAKLEETEGIILTPYERNLEFWRQLWRVLERSDVVVQIVDARQPLLYYNSDLEVYAHEIDPKKVCVLLVNKADLLSQAQRVLWADFFTSRGIFAIFWSAATAASSSPGNDSDGESIPAEEHTSSVDDDAETLHGSESSDSEELFDAAEGELEENVVEAKDKPQRHLDEQIDICTKVANSGTEYNPFPSDQTDTSPDVTFVTPPVNADVVNVVELLNILTGLLRGLDAKLPDRDTFTIGFVGYPNVGKSSTLNALLQQKKTSVSATPGHTKHFQTLVLRPGLVLCDCPGLVMPSFAHSRADLVLAGILSIDEMRDFIAPIGLICEQIPYQALQTMYSVNLPKPSADTDASQSSPTARQFLAAHAYNHGFMTSKGNPHYDRSARAILKDYVQGRLLYTHPPPGTTAIDYRKAAIPVDCLYPPELAAHVPAEKLVRLFSNRSKVESTEGDAPKVLLTEFDRLALSGPQRSGVGVRSSKKLPHAKLDDGDAETASMCSGLSSTSSWSTVNSVGGSSLLSGIGATYATSTVSGCNKPWRLLSSAKRLNTVQPTHHVIDEKRGSMPRKRKEKLRRVYADLDRHELT